MEMTMAFGFIILALYGWYMYLQGKNKGFKTGAMSGAATALVRAIMLEKITRVEARSIMPILDDVTIDTVLETLKSANANLQP
jgi:hypothetical protein